MSDDRVAAYKHNSGHLYSKNK